LVRVKDRICLFRCVQVTGVAGRAATRIVAGVGDLMQMTEDGCTGRILDGWTIERSGAAVCGLHRVRRDEKRGFLVEPQNQGRRFISGLASKPLGRFSLVWPQNWW
jgi:hypothetical protein